MTKFYLVFCMTCLFLTSATALAAPIPKEALDKDYQSCLDRLKDQPDTTPDQAQKYCGCIRKRMENWDLQSYENLIKSHVEGKSLKDDERIQNLAMVCVMQAYK